MKIRFSSFLVMIVLLAACRSAAPAAPSPLPASPTSTTRAAALPLPAPTLASSPTPTPSGPCRFTAGGEVVIYRRPSLEAEVFSSGGEPLAVPLQVRTDSGWLGFEPGVAQAANTGEFRYRWVPPGTPTLTGDCASLLVVWAPPPGVCFLMPMGPTPVRERPEEDAPVRVVLEVDQFAALTAQSAGGDWIRVDTGPGNTGLQVTGWIEAGLANVSGPCPPLPVE
jgi:hypothetical protein